ncbi:protein jag, partial [Campylobacter upsaliensis]|nr:protein jag [Campylobacter upsaliensis]
ISLKEIKMYDENCIFIRLDGEDSALLIGKEAHRYKAFSYLLHNWINLKYNLLVRLEIAEFLEKQIQGMQFYLQGVAEKIKQSGRGQTKPLDGVLIKIALEELRAMFPHKYVGIKQNGEQRFVVVNDFVKKDE